MKYTTELVLLLVVAFLRADSALGGGAVGSWGGTGNTAPSSVALDSYGCVYVAGGYGGTTDFDPGAGTNSHTAGGFRDAFLSKFSPTGTWLWTKVWGGPSDDRANSVLVCGSNVFVAGCFQDTVEFNPAGGEPHTAPRNSGGFPDNDAYLCAYDLDGNFKWARTWGGYGGDESYDLAVDGSNNVYVCGDFGSTNIDLVSVGLTGVFTNNGRWDAFLFKFDSAGTCQWARSWGGNCYDDCTCVAVTPAGEVYGGGMFASPIADFDPGPGTNYLHANNAGTDWGLVDVFLTKFDSNGNFQWARSWGESNHWDAAQGIAVDGAANVYVSGYFTDTVDFNPYGVATNIATHGGDDAFLCKYDASGTFQWVNTWGGSSNDYARGIGMDAYGYIYVAGDFASSNVNFDSRSGVDLHSTVGGRDISFSKFDANGKFIFARTCGGGLDDGAFGGVVVDAMGNAFMTGSFRGPADFGPLIGGTTNPPYHGGDEAFVARFPTCWALTVTQSGNGWSSLGAGSPVTRPVSLGISTQLVFTAGDWYHIGALSSNGITMGAATGMDVYTQALVNIAADVSNAVTFVLAGTNQTGYANVPTEWLTNWAESAVVSDPAFDVHAKYLLGLDPTTFNVFGLDIESFTVSGTQAVTVLKRTVAGGLSPDGMHGQLVIQATESLDSPFTNIAVTAVTGTSVFDGFGRRVCTNTVENAGRVFIRAVIQ